MCNRKIRDWWWVDFRVDHVRYRLRSPENTPSGAKAYEALLRHRLSTGQPVRPEESKAKERTFADFTKEWLGTYVRANTRPATQRLYGHTLSRHLVPAFGSCPLSEIDIAKIERFKTAKLAQGQSCSTINLYANILKKCLHDAVEWGYLAAPPKIKMLKQPARTFDFLSRQEADGLISAMGAGTWRAMATVALNTGMRIGELCALQWPDIDFQGKQLVVRRGVYAGKLGPPKNNRERQIPLSEEAMTALSELPRNNTFVFVLGRDAPIEYRKAQSRLARACRQAGLRRIGWHVLRHTFASWLCADGVPIVVVKALLGHASIEMTMRYSHLAPSSLRSAIDLFERRGDLERVPYAWAADGQRPSTTPLPAVGNTSV